MDTFKRERMERVVQESDPDVIVASSFENVYYLSGAPIMTQRQIPERLELVIWRRGAEPIMLVCDIEANFARTHSWISDQRSYVEFKTSPIQLLADTLRELGCDKARIGLEMRHLTAHFFQELRQLLPNAELESCDGLLDRVRMVKSPAEIALLSHGAMVTDTAISRAWSECGPGATEKALANRMQAHLMEGGADMLAFLVVGVADGARLAHPVARERRMEEGDLVRVDFAGFFSGYYSDLARTGIVGKANDHARDIYHKLWEVHDQVIDACRPGVPVSTLFFRCRDEFAKRGLNFNMPHIGHGLGIGLHEHPILEPQNMTLLEEGMVLAIEPIHGEPDQTRYHVEDLVIIRENAPHVASRSYNWQQLFVLN